jgi:hypothetical protein
MGARVRFDPEHPYYLEVVGHGRLHVEDGERLVGTLEVAGPAYLYSLQQALTRDLHYHGGEILDDLRVELSPVSEAIFDRDFAPYDWISLVFDEGRPLVQVVVVHTAAPDVAAVENLLGPLLHRHKASCDSIDSTEQNDAHLLEVLIDWPTKGRTVADAWAFGGELEALLYAAEGGEITAATALDLLRAGRWDVFGDSLNPTGWRPRESLTTSSGMVGVGS